MKTIIFLLLILSVFSRLSEDSSSLSNYHSFRQQLIRLSLEVDFETKM